MRKEYNLELNGYANFLLERMAVNKTGDFTVTIAFTPYTYESCISGILSSLSLNDKKGIAVGIMKQGMVTVKIGLEDQVLEVNSLDAHAVFQKPNVITIAFWGTAGWCDLYVNGVLSNRKQFRRHSEIRFPQDTCYIGKYVDGSEFFHDTRRGVFHGRLDYIEYTSKYKGYQQMAVCYTQQADREQREINLYAMQDFSRDIYRPVYHMMPPGKWMNEPHAPFYYHGCYHIFYQANPHAPVWDNLCWGHLVSEDMVQWRDAGIALYPDDENIDIDGCWSGSACMDFENVPVLFYTGGNNDRLPNQSVAIARPADLNDKELKDWKKEGIVLRQEIGKGFFGEFRDPFVWRDKNRYYIMVGTGDVHNGGGNALIYTSDDLKSFHCHGFVVDYDYDVNTEAGHVWELPVLLPLKDEKGAYCCDILIFCACQIENDVVENYYFLGRFDDVHMKFQKYHASPRLLDLGNGIFTGPSGFVAPDGRSILFTIAQGKRDPQEEYDAGWAHNGGMPVELSMREDILRISPISEIRRYFTRSVVSEEVEPKDFGVAVLQQENLSENRILISAKGRFLELVFVWKEDAWTVSYDRKTRKWKAVSGKSGCMVSKIRSEEDFVDIGKEDIEMECYVDHSMIELYLNGRKSMTLRSYPFCKENRLYVKSDGACRISIWEYSGKTDGKP